jgi:ribonuclease VapC
MIAVDTSALMAIILDEPEADACSAALETDENIVISAATIAEALIVSTRRGLGSKMAKLIDRLNCTVVEVTSASSQRMAQAYSRWGKGLHPAGLNFGDCFAYDIAKEHACRLLYVGNDFGKTDVEGVL